jgi:hypothetical protein
MASLQSELKRITEMEIMQHRIDVLEYELAEARKDRKLIASRLMTTTEFYDWLMDQDKSCAITYSPSNERKRVIVDDKDDVELAIAFSEETTG